MSNALSAAPKRQRGESTARERRTNAGVFRASGPIRSLALRAEYRVKQLTKRQKERLVAEGAVFAELLSSLQTPEIKSD